MWSFHIQVGSVRGSHFPSPCQDDYGPSSQRGLCHCGSRMRIELTFCEHTTKVRNIFAVLKSLGFRTCCLPQYSLPYPNKDRIPSGICIGILQRNRTNTVGEGRETDFKELVYTTAETVKSQIFRVSQQPGDPGRAKDVRSKVCMPTEFLFAQQRSIVL